MFYLGAIVPRSLYIIIIKRVEMLYSCNCTYKKNWGIYCRTPKLYWNIIYLKKIKKKNKGPIRVE